MNKTKSQQVNGGFLSGNPGAPNLQGPSFSHQSFPPPILHPILLTPSCPTSVYDYKQQPAEGAHLSPSASRAPPTDRLRQNHAKLSDLTSLSPTTSFLGQEQVSLPKPARTLPRGPATLLGLLPPHDHHCQIQTRAKGDSRSRDSPSPASLALGQQCALEAGHLPWTTGPCRRHCSLPSGAGSVPSWKRGLWKWGWVVYSSPNHT